MSPEAQLKAKKIISWIALGLLLVIPVGIAYADYSTAQTPLIFSFLGTLVVGGVAYASMWLLHKGDQQGVMRFLFQLLGWLLFILISAVPGVLTLAYFKGDTMELGKLYAILCIMTIVAWSAVHTIKASPEKI